MSFDPWNFNQHPTPKKHPCSRMTYCLMALVIESNNPWRVEQFIRKIVQKCWKNCEKRVVEPEEIWELKEIEMEMKELKISFGHRTDELNASINAVKHYTFAYWIAFIATLIGISQYQGSFHESYPLYVIIGLLVIAWSVFLLTPKLQYKHYPANAKLAEEYESQKTQLKSCYEETELALEQTKLVSFFLDDFLKARKNYSELHYERYWVKVRSAIPVGLFLLCVFLFYIWSGLNEEREKSYLGEALFTVLLSIFIIPPFVIIK